MAQEGTGADSASEPSGDDPTTFTAITGARDAIGTADMASAFLMLGGVT